MRYRMGLNKDNRTDRQCLIDLQDALASFEEELAEASGANDELNIFEVLGITNTEIRHSNMIAWLMRPRGKHGLGGGVLSSLIDHAGGAVPDDLSDFHVKRESDNIDILATSSKNRLALAIENKVWSGEHDDQLTRYRQIVERRYPGWEHLYLFLSPYGTPPEGEADREDWVPIDYRALLGYVEEALSGAEITAKARLVIEDYVSSVRRHIVGDDSLQSRCVEIYFEHKRAIDLILKNLPDTTKTVHEYAREWAHGLAGVEVVDSCSRGKQYVRYRTKSLEKLFPPIEGGNDNWGQRHYWFYEAISKPAKDGVGCDLSLQICFHLPKNAPLSDERRELARRFTEAFAQDGEGAFYGTWTGVYRYVSYLATGEFGYEDVRDACDEAWAKFLAREEAAAKAVFE